MRAKGQEPQQAAKTLKFIHVSFMAAGPIYLALGYLLEREGMAGRRILAPEVLGHIKISLLVVTVVLFPILRALQRTFNQRLVGRSLPAVVTPYLILFSLAELPSIFGLVLFLLGGPLKTFFLMVVLSLIYLAFMTPRRDFFTSKTG